MILGIDGAVASANLPLNWTAGPIRPQVEIPIDFGHASTKDSKTRWAWATSTTSWKHLRIVVLKPNKDLAYVNELFEAGKLVPVIDGTYSLADIREALRRYGTGDHHGKVVVRMR